MKHGETSPRAIRQDPSIPGKKKDATKNPQADGSGQPMQFRETEKKERKQIKIEPNCSSKRGPLFQSTFISIRGGGKLARTQSVPHNSVQNREGVGENSQILDLETQQRKCRSSPRSVAKRPEKKNQQ